MIVFAAIFIALSALSLMMLLSGSVAGFAGVQLAVIGATLFLTGIALACTAEIRSAIRDGRSQPPDPSHD